MRAILVSALVLLALLVAGAVGLRTQPRPFPASQAVAPALERVPLPAGLPAPVERFYRRLYGERVPVIDTAVVSGRGTVRLLGLNIPARFRFTHAAGLGYRHYIEVTLFGWPVMRVNESYVDGRARLELPFGVTENEPKVDQAANLGMWAEAVWFPAYYLTDPRVRWEPIDASSAALVVPFGDLEETFVARFDPGTGLLSMLESMRFKEAHSKQRTLWLNEVLAWGERGGYLLPVETTLTWLDDGAPWARFTVEEVTYGVGVELGSWSGAPRLARSGGGGR